MLSTTMMKHSGGGSAMQMRRPFLRAFASASLLLFAGSGSDAIYSDVEISNFDQSALELSFRVSWKTGRGGGGGGDAESSTQAATGSAGSSDTVDIWLLTRQPNPSSWMETMLKEGVENTGSLWIEAGDSWASRGSWDNTISGEASVCIYNSSDPFDNACAEALGIVPSAEAPYASAGDGISNVRVPRVDQNGSTLSFSVTWADGGGAGGTEDTSKLVDIWLTAKQFDPEAWVELPILQNVQNTRMAHLDVKMDWVTMGWDLSREGEISACIYNAGDYKDNDCSEFVAFTGSPDGSTDGNGGDAAGVDDGSVEGSNTTEGSGGNRGSSSSGTGGRVVMILVGGGALVALAAWVMVTTSRRRQRRRWLGVANEAEALPENVFTRPANPYSGF